MENRFIPLHEPDLRGNEAQYLQECVESGWVSSVGPFVSRFESMLAEIVGTRFAVAVSSGTAALHLTMLVAGVGRGEEVLAPALTFIAPINAIRYCGADPVFLDSQEETLGLDPAALEFWLRNNAQVSETGTWNRTTGKRIAACLPVHIFGHPVDMDRILDVCARFRIPVIEDASESLGSTYKGLPTGSLGLAGCFSFNGNKTVTCGGGGAVVTNDEHFANRVRHLSTQAKVNELEYVHDEVGYNYRLTNVQAAVGVAQLERLKKICCRKRQIFEYYQRAFSEHPGTRIFSEQAWASSNYWLNTLFASPEHRMSLIHYAQSRGVQFRPIWQLISEQRMYRDCGNDGLKVAKRIFESGISIPSSSTLTDLDVERVVDTIKQFLGQNVVGQSAR